MTYRTQSAAETEALGERLARQLQGGEVIAFTGDLGAGKTAFTRGLARGLGITDRVTSPTFTIVNEYEMCIRDRPRPIPTRRAGRCRCSTTPRLFSPP